METRSLGMIMVKPGHLVKLEGEVKVGQFQADSMPGSVFL